MLQMQGNNFFVMCSISQGLIVSIFLGFFYGGGGGGGVEHQHACGASVMCVLNAA